MANVAGMSWRGLHGSAQRSEAGGTWALVRGDRLGLPADHTVALQHVLHAADFRPGEPRRAEQGAILGSGALTATLRGHQHGRRELQMSPRGLLRVGCQIETAPAALRS
jgi:hypothetical protein